MTNLQGLVLGVLTALSLYVVLFVVLFILGLADVK